MTVNTADVFGDLPYAALPTGFGDRKELATIAFERTRMPMVITDARQKDNPIVLANKAFLELTGYMADAILGRNCRFLQGTSTSPAAVAQIKAGLAEGNDIDVELLNYRKDGTAFWNQLHISPIYDDEGVLAYYFASQIDVTDFRKIQTLEASEHRLLMEVDHRAKNVLAIVDSLVRLSRADNVAQYAIAVQQRVQALASAHALLSARRWMEVSLREVVHGQVFRHQTQAVAINGPEIFIAASAVQPLALVIHELAVNAVVHGALSKPDGRLSITWEKTDQFGGFAMTWTEIGTKRPIDEPKAGLGTVMVNAMIEQQLVGQLERRWLDRGVEIMIVVPGARHA